MNEAKIRATIEESIATKQRLLAQCTPSLKKLCELAVATLRGSGIVVPYWFLVLLCGLAATALQLERPWRYTTRSLFIAFTFVAIVLGLVAKLDRGPDPSTVDIPAPLDEL